MTQKKIQGKMLIFKSSQRLEQMVCRKGVAHSAYDTSFFPIFLSFLIVAFAQPDWSALLSTLAATGGYALFWSGIKSFSTRNKFFTSWLWMSAVQWIALHWLSSDHYLGPLIHFALALFSLWVGLQFALLSLWINKSVLSAAALWTLFEWSRLYFLSGYALNPVGLALTGSPYSLQMASFCGVFGLSFLAILTNLLLYQHKRSVVLVLLLPYLLGAGLVHYHQKKMESAPHLKALLLQHATLPEEMHAGVWQKICALAAPYVGERFDLIVLPEAAVPYSATDALYPLHEVDALIAYYFGGRRSGLEDPYISNVQIGQALSRIFGTTLIMGVEDKMHNAAYAITDSVSSVYYKQVLLPFGEYLPKGFAWCAAMIPGFTPFMPGERTTLLQGDYGVSICYEEMVGHVIRKSKLLGAKCLINLSNDVWYPGSRLCTVHYLHGRLRAVELGLPLLRACNTGLTCGVDATGRLIGALPPESFAKRAKPAALSLSLPLYQYRTLYTYVGNYLIITLSFFLVLPKKEKIR